MTNKNIAKTWFSIIGFAFLYGVYCGVEGVDPDEGAIPMAIIKLGSVIFSFWGMARLWKSVPEKTDG